MEGNEAGINNSIQFNSVRIYLRTNSSAKGPTTCTKWARVKERKKHKESTKQGNL